MRPEGGSPEIPGRVQPHSLLRESVTGGDLYRREPYFISPDEGPALHLPRPPLGATGNQDATKGAKGTPAATTGPLPGVGFSAPPQQRAYLWGGPCFMRRGEGSGSRLLSCCPQRDPPGGRGAAAPGSSADIVT